MQIKLLANKNLRRLPNLALFLDETGEIEVSFCSSFFGLKDIDGSGSSDGCGAVGLANRDTAAPQPSSGLPVAGSKYFAGETKFKGLFEESFFKGDRVKGGI